MELFERWAYYGVRVVLSIYIVKAASEGGLQFNHIQKGQIYSGWAFIQSTLPILTGGYADRYGYRKIVFLAIIAKVCGYLLMATQHTFWGFFGGCMLLAAGTAVFKPAVQGTLASSLNSKNSSIGWGIFYWLINLGGFLGAWLAGYFRMISWPTVFYANACIVSMNFIILAFSPPSSAVNQLKSSPTGTSFWTLPFVSLKDMFQPQIFSFLLAYSGYWMMYNQIFDTLPNFLDDWVHSSEALVQIGNFVQNKDWTRAGSTGQGIPHEWILSLNTLTFIFFMIPLAWLVRKLHPIYSMVGGIVLTVIGMGIFGFSQSAWLCIAGIIIFSIGEMGAGPRMREYLGLLAPKGKEGSYMGYANLPEAIGWGFGSLVAGYWYEVHSDKHTLAKNYLAQTLHWPSEIINKLPKENILPTLASKLGVTQFELTNLLWAQNNPNKIWFWFMAIATISAIGLIWHHLYFGGRIERLEAKDNTQKINEDSLMNA